LYFGVNRIIIVVVLSKSNNNNTDDNKSISNHCTECDYQCLDTVDWDVEPVKIKMTYVSGGTLNPTRLLTHFSWA